jgi:hypothetical protein
MRSHVSVYCSISCSLLVGLAGCSTSPEPESRALGISLGSALTAEGAGFVHIANNSKFRIGANPTPKLEFGMSKLVGSEGVFGTIPETGWVLAIPNGRAPSTLADPLTRSPDLHNQRVRDYFVAAGLPAAQVGAVTAHGSVKGGGTGDPTVQNGDFAGYTSVITRVVGGVPVPDSFAWARFNVNGDVVEEQVYWPTIPANVVQDAKTLSAIVSDRAQFAVFAKNLPPNMQNGQVVIRHSPGNDRAAFEAVAAYDMVQLGEMGSVHHFDTTGIEFKMASEVRSSQMSQGVAPGK